jgi:hypothetical protein
VGLQGVARPLDLQFEALPPEDLSGSVSAGTGGGVGSGTDNRQARQTEAMQEVIFLARKNEWIMIDKLQREVWGHLEEGIHGSLGFADAAGVTKSRNLDQPAKEIAVALDERAISTHHSLSELPEIEMRVGKRTQAVPGKGVVRAEVQGLPMIRDRPLTQAGVPLSSAALPPLADEPVAALVAKGSEDRASTLIGRVVHAYSPAAPHLL